MTDLTSAVPFPQHTASIFFYNTINHNILSL